MNFLTAQWQQLILVNYTVPPAILKPYIPKGTELDLWQDQCYVSLVGFLFKDTKVLGIKIPKHHTFEEVNLRFYVKRFESGSWKRGVVFIKEIVPKKTLTWVANTLYKEHYETQTMSHSHERKGEVLNIQYTWQQNQNQQSIAVNAYDFLTPIDENTEAEFILEHYYGYTQYNNHTTFEYEVQHPKWEQYFIKNYTIDVDFEQEYGSSFAILNNLKPRSVYLAKGSEIKVKSKRKITTNAIF